MKRKINMCIFALAMFLLLSAFTAVFFIHAGDNNTDISFYITNASEIYYASEVYLATAFPIPVNEILVFTVFETDIMQKTAKVRWKR